MAILESIRKRGIFLILVIGLALFAFVISGVIDSSGFSGGKVGTTVGEVNGETINRDAFAQLVESNTRRYGPNVSTTQVVNSVWNQETRRILLNQQIEELGINVEKDQIVNIIRTNPAFTQDATFQNEAGFFDEGKFIEFIADLQANNPLAYDGWKTQEAALIQNAKEQMYFNLIKAGVGATLKEGELNYKLENDKVDIKFVRVPYTSILDSTVSVSKKEIEAYVKEHKNDFQEEASRSIRYVFFEEKPSVEDEAEAKNSIEKLINESVEFNNATNANDTIPGFAQVAASEMNAFLSKYSDIKYDTTYITRNALPSAFADSIYTLNVGETYGIYRDADYFKVTRMMDKKSRATVKASHILLAYKGADRAAESVTRTKEEAEALANRLLAEIKRDSNKFEDLARENSDDPGSAARGGSYDNIAEGQMVPEFNDYIFNKPVGEVGVVETSFGYHIIKVDNSYEGIRIATLARKVEPSQKTIDNLFTEATKFEMASLDKDFNELATEGGYTVRPVNKIKALDENLPGLTNQRQIVKWAFNEDTEVGEIKRFDLSTGYAIAQVTGKTKKGLATAEDASARVLPILRKQKKAAMIISNNGGKNMDAFAKDNNVAVSTASALNMKTPTIPGAGREPKVVGTAFALTKDATSGLIEGENGVYMIQVTNKVEAPALDNYTTYANTLKTSNAGRVNSLVFNALREAAEIEDNRADFY